MIDSTERYRIVVGVDGSPSSEHALRWCAWHAQQIEGEIVAISAWNTTLIYNYEVPTGDEFVHMLRTSLAKIVADAVGDSAEVHQIVVHDHPAHALLEHARNANLLVLGTRGHGGFAGALLGSVGQHCVQHAPCPVLIVRQPAKS